MRRTIFILSIALAAMGPRVAAQTTPAFPSFSAFVDSLETVAEISDPSRRSAALDAFWASIRDHEMIPYAQGDSVAFLWRGEAERVQWAGDFNGWRPDAPEGSRVGESEVWMLRMGFPRQARVDYKIIVDGEWLLDHANPFQQMSGFGFNSELRMPDYVYPQVTVRRPSVPVGSVSANVRMTSNSLGYDLQYRVYTPAGYTGDMFLPVIYVVDGHEYLHDDMGSMRVVLDNLIHDRRAEPIIAVFVDSRDPDDLAINRRAEQFKMNPDYLAFVRDELVPEIDAAYATIARPEARAILGTSFGGVNATYFGLEESDVFGLVAIQSPAFHAGRPLFDRLEQEDTLPIKIFLSTGTLNDGEEATREMATLLMRKDYQIRYVEVHEGHSWGNWRALLDDLLVYFFPGDGDVRKSAVDDSSEIRLRHYPSADRGRAVVAVDLADGGLLTVSLFDLMGQRVGTPVQHASCSRGSHHFMLNTNRLDSGPYLARIEVGERTASSMLILKR